MNIDLTKLAAQMRSAHANGVPIRLPAMTGKDLGLLIRILDLPAAAPSNLLH